MNKAQLIRAISDNTAISQRVIELVIAEMADVIGETIANGEEVLLVDFGKFKSKFKKGRNCRNPKTGESIYIEDAIIPVFKAGKRLKQTVNTIGKKDESI